jgi:4-hydroxy-tetrahydrodipicolinate synthase
MSKARFGEVITAMVTPFAEDGSMDVRAARSLAARLVEHGSDGLVLSGTTGESPTLSLEDKLALFEHVIDEVGGRAKIIAGTGTYDTAESISLTRAAGALGVDACLVVTPYYSKPPQNGLLVHFNKVADESSVPVLLYDIPGRTGRRIERTTVLELATGHYDFEIYSGDDAMLMPHLAAGAVGIISVCSHVIGPQIKQIIAAYNDGKVEEAQRIFLEHLPLMTTVMTVTASPIPVKAALNLMGVSVGVPRLPLVDATQEEKAKIRTAMERTGLL